MKYLIIPTATFIVFVVALHLWGIKTKGKYSKSLWKSGDYIWLSMAFFAMVSATSQLRMAQADQLLPEIRKNYVKLSDQRISELHEFTNTLSELVINDPENPKLESKLEQLSNSAKKLDENMENISTEISREADNSKVWAFESWLKNLFPYFLAIGLAIRFTMASAEVLNWYRK